MKNDEIKYYKYVGSSYDADQYGCPKPIRNKVYSETDKISHSDVAYFNTRYSAAVGLEWKLVDKPKQAERRFRLLTQDGYDTITKGKIYSESFSPGVCNFLKFLEKHPNDWQEVFDDEEKVNSPSHYNQSGIECIDAMFAATVNKPSNEAILVSNAIKYLWRYEAKNGIKDVKKAQWYINKLVDILDKK
jgi:hypothetical protein